MAPKPTDGKKSQKSRGRKGLGEKTLIQYCRLWLLENECSAYLGPMENIIRIGFPEWSTMPDNTRTELLQCADHGAARHDGALKSLKSADFLDALWLDVSTRNDNILGRPWVVFLKEPPQHSDKILRDVYSALMEIRKKAGGNRRRRELYYLLVLRWLRSHVNVTNLLRIRVAALAIAQRERNIFPDSRTASWDKSSVNLDPKSSPFLRDLPSAPREALSQVLEGVSSTRDNLNYLRNKHYEFLPFILSGQNIEDIGREQHAKQLETFISGSPERPFFSIVGSHGTGKTTFVRAYLKAQAAKGRLFPCFFVDWRKGQRCRPQRILEHLMIEANPSHVLDLGAHLPMDEHESAEQFWRAVACFSGERPAKRIVIFLDAQDETENNPYKQLSLTQILLRAREDDDLPPGVRFILSCRPSEGFRKLVDTYDIDFDVDQLQSDLVVKYFDTGLRSLGISAPDATVQELVHRCQQSFSYADLLTRRIIEHGGLTNSLHELPTKPEDMLKTEWQRFQNGPLSEEDTRTLLSVLLAHLGTPSLSDLHNMAGLSADKLLRFFQIHGHHFDIETGESPTLGPGSRIRRFHYTELAQNIEDHELWPDDLVNAHIRIVESYQKRHPGRAWCNVPGDKYFFGNLAYHLAEAGRLPELKDLLLDYRWLQAKLKATDVQALLNDFSVGACTGDADVRLVERSIRLSAHVLVGDPDQLCAQMYGRLLPIKAPIAQTLRDSVLKNAISPWLRPVTCSLRSPADRLVSKIDIGLFASDMTVVSGGPYLAFCSGHECSVWDYSRFTAIANLSTEGFWGALSATSDGNVLILSDLDGTISIWDWKHRKQIKTVPFRDPLYLALAVSTQRGEIFAPTSHSLEVFDLETGAHLRCLNDTLAIEQLAMARDGRTLVAVCKGSQVVAIDAHSGVVLEMIARDNALLTAMAIAPDDQLAVFAWQNGELTLWNVRTRKLIGTLGPNAFSIHALTFSDDGSHIISGDTSGNLTVWGTASGRRIESFKSHWANVHLLAIIPSSQHCLSAGYDGVVALWNMEQEPDAQVLTQKHSESILAVGVTADGDCVTSASSEGVLKGWSLRTGRAFVHVDATCVCDQCAAITPDGRYLTYNVRDNLALLELWDRETNNIVQRFANCPVENMVDIPEENRRVDSWVSKPLQVTHRCVDGDCVTRRRYIPYLDTIPLSAHIYRAIREGQRAEYSAEFVAVRNKVETPPGLLDERLVAVVPNAKRVAFQKLGILKVWDLSESIEVCSLSIGPAAGGPLAISTDGNIVVRANCLVEGKKSVFAVFNIAEQLRMMTPVIHDEDVT